MALLPPDIILLICEEIAKQRDFGTLFHCAISSRNLAGSALLWMYRIHTQAAGESNARLMVWKWAIQWRSIILSSIGKTLYPYCLYIRSLDLADLGDLLEEHMFRDAIAERFFANEMEVFSEKCVDTRTPNSSLKVAKYPFLKLVGDSISRFLGESAAAHGGAVALEEIAGTLEKSALTRWVTKLSRLKYIRIWNGRVLDNTVAELIATHCLKFDSLSIYLCNGSDADAILASFLRSLRPNTLRSLEVISHNELGKESFLALTHHSGSLKDLKINGLQSSVVSSLTLLRSCTAIQTLELRECGGVFDLEATENVPVLREITAWLTNCKQLKSISWRDFSNGPAVLTPICLMNDIRLESLTLNSYHLANNQEFHLALAHQTNLESLDIAASPERAFRDDIDVLVMSLCCLVNLKHLRLLDTSDYFSTPNVQLIVNSLTKLEELSIAGYGIDDRIWASLSSLHHLRSLSFHALTSFTYSAIIKYISTLTPTNAGLQLSILCATSEGELTSREERKIKEDLAEKVNGKFEFVMFGDADSEYETESD